MVVGAKELDKLSVSGRPSNLGNSRQGPIVLAVGAGVCGGGGGGGVGHFFSRLSFLFSFSLSGRRPDID